MHLALAVLFCYGLRLSDVYDWVLCSWTIWTAPFWRRRFGADVLAPTFWRRSFGAGTFWRRDVLAPLHFFTTTFFFRRICNISIAFLFDIYLNFAFLRFQPRIRSAQLVWAYNWSYSPWYKSSYLDFLSTVVCKALQHIYSKANLSRFKLFTVEISVGRLSSVKKFEYQHQSRPNNFSFKI